MDYYTLDKRCPSILSPPVISSTSCLSENGTSVGAVPPGTGGSANGSAYRAPDTLGSYSIHDKDLSTNGGDLFGSGDYSIPSYYNLDQHQQFDDLKNKSHMSYHHMQQTQVYNMACSMKMDTGQSAMYSSKPGKYDLYSMQQCPPQSTTSPPIMSIPDSPSISNSGNGAYHTVTGQPPSSQQQQTTSPDSNRSMCIAKKSTSTNGGATGVLITTANGGYELKREMVESSGLSASTYYKARSGRKGFWVSSDSPSPLGATFSCHFYRHFFRKSSTVVKTYHRNPGSFDRLSVWTLPPSSPISFQTTTTARHSPMSMSVH